MEIQLSITPEQIQESISKSLIDSAVGGQIIKGIEEILSPKYGQPSDLIKEAIKTNIRVIINDFIRENYSDVIKTKIREALSEDKVIDNIVSATISNLQAFVWK